MEIVGRSNRDVDRVVWVEDLSVRSLIQLIDRLRQTEQMEQFIFREAEMDDAYRRADADLRLAVRVDASQETVDGLERVRALIFAAHDFVGLSDTARAIEELNKVIEIKTGLGEARSG